MYARRRSLLKAGLASMILPTVVLQAHAQDKPIRIIVGFPAGGSVDFVARLVGDKISKTLGQPVIVENRPGASGRTAAQFVKDSPPDGTTLLATPGAAMYLYPHMFKQLRYDPFKDFAPVNKLVSWELGLIVPASSGISSLQQFLDVAKRDRSMMFFASPSAGSVLHFTGVELARRTGVALEHVPFKGASDAAAALLGNQIPAAMLNMGDLAQLHRGGRARVLVNFSGTRSTVLPDVPTIKELGYPELVADGWAALYAPAATPPAILSRIESAVNAALRESDVKAKLLGHGLIAQSGTRQQLDELGKYELQRWRDVVKVSNYQEE